MTKRKTYLDVLRILAIFAVVVIHITAGGVIEYPVNSFIWNVSNVTDGLSRFCVPLFIMISGALMLNNSKELPLKKLYFKNCLHLAIVFIIWATIYGLIKMEAFTVSAFLKEFGSYHLWFIPLIIGLYIIAPLLRKITADKKATEYFLIISLIFTFLIPTILSIPQLSYVKEYYNSSVFFHFTLGFSPYFVLGHYLDEKELNKNHLFIGIAALLVGALTMVLGTRYLSIKANASNYILYDFLSIPCLLMSSGIFIIGKVLFKKQTNEKLAKTLAFISNNCFGVFIVHALVIFIFNKIGFTFTCINPIIGSIVVSLSAFLLSLGISIGINAIPFVNKFLL